DELEVGGQASALGQEQARVFLRVAAQADGDGGAARAAHDGQRGVGLQHVRGLAHGRAVEANEVARLGCKVEARAVEVRRCCADRLRQRLEMLALGERAHWCTLPLCGVPRRGTSRSLWSGRAGALMPHLRTRRRTRTCTPAPHAPHGRSVKARPCRRRGCPSLRTWTRCPPSRASARTWRSRRGSWACAPLRPVARCG